MSTGRPRPVRESGGVKILMYHWISGDPGQRLRHWGVTPDQFEGQMRHLHEQGYRTLRLSEVAQAVQGLRPLSERTVALTFDDGYRDFLHFAAPILEEYGFTATVFLVADRVGEINAWDERHGDPPRPLLSWEEAAELATRGFESWRRRLPGRKRSLRTGSEFPWPISLTPTVCSMIDAGSWFRPRGIRVPAPISEVGTGPEPIPISCGEV
ncbi:MAG: hypothetical protein DMH00_09990 [Acidobacteria bacterium]|nr:MAG: hypothetical protein DMH00_09990 [Acidobacteriota bacterium]